MAEQAGPSRAAIRRDAKRSMYAFSTEKAVTMGVKTHTVGRGREAAKANAADKVHDWARHLVRHTVTVSRYAKPAVLSGSGLMSAKLNEDHSVGLSMIRGLQGRSSF